jgi:hypothetical protein
VEVVKEGTGKPLEGSGGAEFLLRFWTDRYEGTPAPGRKEVRVIAAWEDKELWPGLRRMMEGSKEGAVARSILTLNKLYGHPPQLVYPMVPLYCEAKLVKVFPPEPVEVKTVKPGSGPREAQRWDYLKVDFTAWSEKFEGKKFDDRKSYVQKLDAAVGVPGWYPALLGMKKGEVRRVKVPHYRAVGYPGKKAPPGKTIFYQVKLVDFVDDPKPQSAPGKRR